MSNRDSQFSPMKASINIMECKSCRDKVIPTNRQSESYENGMHSSTPKRPIPKTNLN